MLHLQVMVCSCNKDHCAPVPAEPSLSMPFWYQRDPGDAYQAHTLNIHNQDEQSWAVQQPFYV